MNQTLPAAAWSAAFAFAVAGGCFLLTGCQGSNAAGDERVVEPVQAAPAPAESPEPAVLPDDRPVRIPLG